MRNRAEGKDVLTTNGREARFAICDLESRWNYMWFSLEQRLLLAEAEKFLKNPKRILISLFRLLSLPEKICAIVILLCILLDWNLIIFCQIVNTTH